MNFHVQFCFSTLNDGIVCSFLLDVNYLIDRWIIQGLMHTGNYVFNFSESFPNYSYIYGYSCLRELNMIQNGLSWNQNKALSFTDVFFLLFCFFDLQHLIDIMWLKSTNHSRISNRWIGWNFVERFVNLGRSQVKRYIFSWSWEMKWGETSPFPQFYKIKYRFLFNIHNEINTEIIVFLCNENVIRLCLCYSYRKYPWQTQENKYNNKSKLPSARFSTWADSFNYWMNRIVREQFLC